MCRLQPAAHFVRGNTADLWTTARDCPDANQKREPIHRRTIRSDICILSICTPWKSANTYPPSLSFPLILCPPPPPDEGSTPWPQGQPLSLWPARLPLLLLVYPSDPVRPGYNTWPRPRDGPIGVQGKCPFLHVCLQAALPGPCPIFTCVALFLMLSHKKLWKKNTPPFYLQGPALPWKWKFFFLWGFSIVFSATWQHSFRDLWFFPPFSIAPFYSSGSTSSALRRKKGACQEVESNVLSLTTHTAKLWCGNGVLEFSKI